MISIFRHSGEITYGLCVLVPPTDAVVEQIGQNDQSSGRVSVNCTSSGLPAPNLVWTIGDQKVFSSNYLFAYTPSLKHTVLSHKDTP